MSCQSSGRGLRHEQISTALTLVRDPFHTPAAVYILVMYGAAVIWHGMSGHGQLPRVPLGVTHVVTGYVFGSEE